LPDVIIDSWTIANGSAEWSRTFKEHELEICDRKFGEVVCK
jgi:hypothetical protein